MKGNGTTNPVANNIRVRAFMLEKLADIVDELNMKIKYIQEAVKEVENMTEEEKELNYWKVHDIDNEKQKLVAYQKLIETLEKL